MDQGTAAVIAAGFGIAGTLGGALGGAWFAGRVALRQVAAQERADIRSRLRDERRAAFADVLSTADATGRALSSAVGARAARSDDESDRDPDVWQAIFEPLTDLRRAVNTVLITGPEDAYQSALAMYEARSEALDSMYNRLDWRQALSEHSSSVIAFEEARKAFLAAAQRAMAEPEV